MLKNCILQVAQVECVVASAGADVDPELLELKENLSELVRLTEGTTTKH